MDDLTETHLLPYTDAEKRERLLADALGGRLDYPSTLTMGAVVLPNDLAERRRVWGLPSGDGYRMRFRVRLSSGEE